MKTDDFSNRNNSDANITRRRAYRLKKIGYRDINYLFLIMLFGMLTAWTGQMNGLHMTPHGAAKTSRMLDELELPRQLPNHYVKREDGASFRLWDLISKKRNVVTVYAPWCPACQKELPLLVEKLSETKNLIVLISKKQKPVEVEEQLKNLGLSSVHYYRDITGQILTEGKVSKLPTTFLLRDYGRVIDRVVGFSEYGIERLIKRAKEVP